MLNFPDVVTSLTADIVEDSDGVDVADVVLVVCTVFSLVCTLMWVDICFGLVVSPVVTRESSEIVTEEVKMVF